METIFLVLAVLLFAIAVVGWLNRSLYGDVGVAPFHFMAASVAAFVLWLSLKAGLSLPSFFLLFVAVVSAYKFVSSLLYGDIEWGYALLFIIVSIAILIFSAQEMADLAKPYLYNNNSTNTTS